MKRRARVATAVVVVGAIAVVLYHLRETKEISAYHVCRVCGSYRVTCKTIVNGVEVRASSETVLSDTFTDLLGEGREHDWAFGHSDSESRRGFLFRFTHGDGFPGLTGRMPNRFTSAYNEDAGFRAFVKARIASGDLSSDLVARIVLLDDLDGNSPAASKARRLRSEFFGHR